MNDGTPQPRSVAAELALLFLRELEPQVANDPELLVSTEAVLSFAAIRHADPVQWEYWRAILEKYEKSELIEYMLRQPACIKDLELEVRRSAPQRSCSRRAPYLTEKSVWSICAWP